LLPVILTCDGFFLLLLLSSSKKKKKSQSVRVCVFFFVFSEKREAKKKAIERRRRKKMERERNSLSPQQHALSPQTHLCVLRELVVSTHLDVFWRYSLSARAYSFIYNTLSLCYYVYSAALFFRFLKLRNKIRTLSLLEKLKEASSSSSRLLFVSFSLALSLLARA
jgi:hypothetical protein